MSDNEPDLAPVHQLHPDREVHEAVVVSDRERELLATPAGRAQLRREGYWDDTRAVVAATGRVIRHQRTRAGAKLVARNAWHVPQGGWVVARWMWANWTTAGYARSIQAAEARQDWEAVERLHEAKEAAVERRHKRILNYLKAPKELLKAVGVVLLLVVGGMLALGLAAAWAFNDPGLVTGPFRAVAWALAGLAWLVVFGGPILVGGIGAVLVVGLWWVGRRAGEVPDVLATEHRKAHQPGDAITQERAVTAFRDLGIALLRQAIDKMPDGGNSLLLPPGITRSGCGVEFDFALPSGVDVEDVLERQSKLSGNLLRHKHEVFPTIAPAARTIRVWAAHSGALDEPIGTSPLVYDTEIRADYHRGAAPWGEDLRGDPFGLRITQCHLLLTGLSKMGKTAALRALALWLVTDRKPRIRLADLKGFGDWSMFSNLAELFIEGCAKEHIIAATEMIEDAVEEMKHRLTHRITEPPLIVLVDEAQLAFASDATDPAGVPYGGSKNRSRFYQACLEILNQGRAVNVLLWLGTQDPTNQNLPERVREAMHIRCSLALGNAKKTRMALGEKAADTGASPHNLRYGIDRGTVVVSGDGVDFPTGQAHATVRTYFIDDDQAEGIADRALALRGPVTRLDTDEPRDLLQDVHEALGEDDKTRAAHLADRLRESGHRCYRSINGQRLVEMLSGVGVTVPPGQGAHFWVSAVAVLRALDERDGVYR